MRLIDADAIAKDWSRYKPEIQFTMEEIMIAIENRPTIEAVPVEWIEHCISEAQFGNEKECNVLKRLLIGWKEHCGAKMDEVAE